MAKVLIEETNLTNIANAIREKTGKSELITPPNMASEIESIVTGEAVESCTVSVSMETGIAIIGEQTTSDVPYAGYFSGFTTSSIINVKVGSYLMIFPINSSNTVSVSVSGNLENATSNLFATKGKICAVKVNGAGTLTLSI